MYLTPSILTFSCLLATAGLVVAELQDRRHLKRLCKLAASTAFVLVALSLHAAASKYGQLVLVALLLSWIGDACLLSQRSTWFLSGLGFFLLAHVAFSAAFVVGDLNAIALVVALALLAAVGALALRWLWRRLDIFHKAAVCAYIVAIVTMCSLAVAHSAASRSWQVAAGALAFAASDISVARDRFVATEFLNRAWGLPVYYFAQLLLAWSVA
jgi:uncharacterized membrane protein YhhN